MTLTPTDPDTGEMMRKKKRLDSDSDSELSAMEHPDMELASSHTSDDDDDDYTWGGKLSKSHLSGRFICGCSHVLIYAFVVGAYECGKNVPWEPEGEICLSVCSTLWFSR